MVTKCDKGRGMSKQGDVRGERELSMAERVLFCFIIQIGTPLIHDVAESRAREEGGNGAKF